MTLVHKVVQFRNNTRECTLNSEYWNILLHDEMGILPFPSNHHLTSQLLSRQIHHVQTSKVLLKIQDHCFQVSDCDHQSSRRGNLHLMYSRRTFLIELQPRQEALRQTLVNNKDNLCRDLRAQEYRLIESFPFGEVSRGTSDLDASW